jgi:hypothetical protein
VKKSDLKKVVKQLVRESLVEIFAEMRLETIVESAVKKHVSSAPAVAPQRRSITEVLGPDEVPAQPKPSKEELRAQMMDKLGIDDAEWRAIYADTADSDNPVLTGDDSGKPELVSESALRQSGLFRDYSKFVK